MKNIVLDIDIPERNNIKRKYFIIFIWITSIYLFWIFLGDNLTRIFIDNRDLVYLFSAITVVEAILLPGNFVMKF